MRLFERTLFLRSLNYLRISHGYSFRYNVIYPVIFSGSISLLVFFLSGQFALLKYVELLALFVPALSIMTPFFVAALAAVATFSGSRVLDEPFQMSNPVTLEIIGDGGDWEVIELTPRHFLSLLFGYCTLLSFILLLCAIITPLLAAGLHEWMGGLSRFVIIPLLLLFMFFLAQLFINMMLGVYYLADRMHRE